MTQAIALIDAANAADPNDCDGEPLSLVQGRLAQAWVTTLDPEASQSLQLAARAHHLRRWVVPRASYPDGRPGYLRWRRDQKARHATELGELLADAGVEPAIAERASAIVAKIGLGSDPEVQTFEDAVCLTFLQTQFRATAERLDEEHMVNVVAKTLAKMSDAGRRAALTIELDDRDEAIVGQALERG
jgi:hypothetical protein